LPVGTQLCPALDRPTAQDRVQARQGGQAFQPSPSHVCLGQAGAQLARRLAQPDGPAGGLRKLGRFDLRTHVQITLEAGIAAGKTQLSRASEAALRQPQHARALQPGLSGLQAQRAEGQRVALPDPCAVRLPKGQALKSSRQGIAPFARAEREFKGARRASGRRPRLPGRLRLGVQLAVQP